MLTDFLNTVISLAEKRDYDSASHASAGRGEAVGNLWADRPWPIDWLLRFRNDVGFGKPVVSNYADRADDILKAVHLLRQHGMAVGFPMQTADGEVVFPVGKDFTLTADQILELLERGELDAEGVRRSVEEQAAAPMLRRAASS